MDKKQQRIFTALAQVAVYHYADVCYKEKAQKATRYLKRYKLLNSINDGDEAYKQYEEMLIEYVKERLPEKYKVQYDYWGAKCFSDKTHNIQDGWYAGSGSDYRFMLFNSFEALEQYTDDKLNEIHLQEEESY